MKLLLIILSSCLLLGFSSCIEIIDDLSLNADGSGTLKYTVNLSSSKVKINSLLALDSLDGQKIPSIADIRSKVRRVVESLKERPGISNVQLDENYTDFIFKLQCDFNSLETLQTAMSAVIRREVRKQDIPELDKIWLSFVDDKLVRSIPQITVKKASEINQEDRALLRTGTYTSITRFFKEVDHFENPEAKLSKNKRAVMIRKDPLSLTQNPNLLDNTIYLVKTD
jgi:hypothetical protein